jgi:hypothetical protein
MQRSSELGGIKEGRKALRMLDMILYKKGPGGSTDPPKPPYLFLPGIDCM